MEEKGEVEGGWRKGREKEEKRGKKRRREKGIEKRKNGKGGQ